MNDDNDDDDDDYSGGSDGGGGGDDGRQKPDRIDICIHIRRAHYSCEYPFSDFAHTYTHTNERGKMRYSDINQVSLICVCI